MRKKIPQAPLSLPGSKIAIIINKFLSFCDGPDLLPKMGVQMAEPALSGTFVHTVAILGSGAWCPLGSVVEKAAAKGA